MQKITRIQTKFSDWQTLLQELSTRNEILYKILRNFQPVCILNDVMYLRYTGKEKHKDLVKEYYRRYKFFIEQELFKKYAISSIQSSKKLHEKKIQWLLDFVEKVQPKKIEIFCDF